MIRNRPLAPFCTIPSDRETQRRLGMSGNERPCPARGNGGAALEADRNQRTLPERRAAPTGPWGAFPPAGRRRHVRRTAEAGQPYFVDRFPAGLWLWIVLLLAATLVDAVLTLCLLEVGCEEINPLMGYVLQHGVPAFLVCKYVLTVAGLPVLLIFGQFFLFGTRLRVKHLIPALVILYLVLIAYQCRLLQTVPGHALPRSESGRSASGLAGNPSAPAAIASARVWLTPAATALP
jgi:hypothetical protein